MPHSRIAVFVLLTLALLGAAWLWWSSGDGRPPAGPATAGEPPAVAAVTDGIAADGAATETAGEVERTAAAAKGAASSGALRVTAVWPDRAPAGGVMVFLRRSVPGLPYAAFARGLTDGDGVVEFTEVPRGPSTLASDRGDKHKVTVEGGHQEVTFELAGGVAVRGTVRDPGVAGVAGAGVWLQSSDTSWTGGRVATVTDEAGEFTLEHVNPEQSIGAVAAGFSPSKLVDLDVVDTSDPPAVVELVLGPDGGRLEGTVTAAAGEPVAGAVVAAGTRPRHLEFEGERLIEQWTVRTAETDASGFFAIDGLAVGSHPVAVRGDGFGLWRQGVTIESRETSVISVSLQPAATIRGTVTDGDGQPIAEALVRAYDRLPGTSFVAGGQIDFDETFGYRGAIAGAAGNYRIDGITPGTVHVFAQQPRDRSRLDGVSVAYTQTELEVAPSQDAVWNPVIDEGRSIEGVVLYRDGLPMPNLFITLADEKPGGKEHVIVSDGEGVFRFLCLEDSTYEIRVQTWDTPKGSPPVKATGVIPDRGRIELRATWDKPVEQKPGTVVGRIDDVAGRIRNANAATVTLHSDDRWFRPGGKIEDGAFRFDRVTPCRFRLTLKEGESTLAQSDWFELPPAATVDTGVLVTEPAGGARLRVERGEGTHDFTPKLYLRRDGDAGSTTIELGRGTEALADNLTPGDYRITGYFKGMVSVRGELSVVAGQTTEVDIELRAGAPVRCEVWWPEGESKSTSRHYRILDGEGNVFHEFEGGLFTSPTRPYELRSTLPVGRWKIEFSTHDGLKGEVELDVRDTGGEVTARIDLK